MSGDSVTAPKDGRLCAQRLVGGKSLASRLSLGLLLFLGLMGQPLSAAEVSDVLSTFLKNNCFGCHDGESAEGGLDLASLAFSLDERQIRDRWILVHDRVKSGEMPPDPSGVADSDRQSLVTLLYDRIAEADRADILANGRGPLRRLNQDEYQQNLRDVLQLPFLDIRDMLPEDREAYRFNKTASALDMSRVQLAAYLDAAEAALRQAMADGLEPPSVIKYRAAGTQLFSANNTFGEREAMFFAKDNRAVDNSDLAAVKDDPALELALFRSAHWPYYGYPRGFVAKTGRPFQAVAASSNSTTAWKGRLTYHVRFAARAILQTEGYELKPATAPVPMTFRARKPSGPDVSGDVRATGGIWIFTLNQTFTKQQYSCFRQKPLSTVCWDCRFHWLVMSMVGHRRIAIRRFPMVANRVLPFNGWKLTGRSRQSRGRRRHIESCLMILERTFNPLIRKKTRDVCFGVS